MSISVSGSQITFNDGSTQNTSAYGGGFAMRNRIINGAMMIDQRNAGASVASPSDNFITDRFAVREVGGGVASAQQVSTAPTGFVNSLKLTVTTPDSSIVTTDRYFIRQPIEGVNTADLGWGTVNASTVTLSFWVRSSITGTYPVAFRNNANDRSYVATYTINAVDTWEQKTITVAGDTTGTWVTTNLGAGINVVWTVGAGPTYNTTANAWQAGDYLNTSSTTQWIGTNGATFYITGVQLEKGSTATSFDYRPYGTELQLCQRYYYKNGVSSTSNQMTWLVGVISGATAIARAIMRHPVPMRATPTFGYNSLRGYDGTNAAAVSSITSNQCSTDMAQVDFACTGASFTTGRIGLILEGTSSSYIDCSAEL